MHTRGKVLAPFAVREVAVVALVVVGLLVALSARYGFHRDELYFLLAGRHPAWGYPDQPPLTPLLARFEAGVFGATPTGLRVLPAVFAAASVALVALLAREFGAGRAGQLLAAVAAACSGFLLGNGHLLSTTTLDLVLWPAIILVALRLLRTRQAGGAAQSRWWAVLGLLTGIALLNKLLVLSLLLALVAGVLIAGPGPRILAVLGLPVARGPLVAVAAALPFAVPVLWWQATHGWPEFAVARGISSDQGLAGRLLMLPLQLLQLSPGLAPLWIVGLRRLFRDTELRWARPVAVAWIGLCLLVLASGGKAYYPIPLLYAVTAAGCEPAVRWIRDHRAAAAAVLLMTLLTSTLAGLPVLPATQLTVPMAVDPDLGEEVGWPELTAATATGWAAIPASERSRATIVTSNYGEAGAIARYGPALGLPAPYSGHMGLFAWGPPPASADGPVLLIHPVHYAVLAQHFRDCRQVARVDNGHGTPNMEQHAAVVLCAGPDRPWAALWPLLRRY